MILWPNATPPTPEPPPLPEAPPSAPDAPPPPTPAPPTGWSARRIKATAANSIIGFILGIGLVLLVLSSRMLVWGAVGIAAELGVSNLVIGLTVVAVGTSLPELATSVVATRKGEHDIALGNVLGSNIFNTLIVVGLAGVIQPFAVQPEVFLRDIPVMALLTVLLFIFGFGFSQQGRINRVEGAVLLGCYIAYTVYLVLGSFQHG